jgi:ribosomal protein L11 methyltransferase
MRQWNYLQASFDPGDSDQASTILWSLGTQGIEEDPSQSRRLRIKAYFDSSYDIHVLEREFQVQCRRARVRLFSCFHKVESERDWFKKWRQRLQSFTVGRRFQIVAGDKPLVPSSDKRLVIYLQPGMAFGTGSHETTQLCLEAMERYLTPASTFFDVGTGSGILAIAALKLGVKKVIACDVDPIAVEIAADNAKRNKCTSKIRWILGEMDRVPAFWPDVLVANLTVELLEEEFRKFERRLKPGSWLILSGILNDQAFRLERLRRKSSLEFQERRRKNEWTCLVYRKVVMSDE